MINTARCAVNQNLKSTDLEFIGEKKSVGRKLDGLFFMS